MQYGYTTINLRNMCHISVNVFLKLEEVRINEKTFIHQVILIGF